MNPKHHNYWLDQAKKSLDKAYDDLVEAVDVDDPSGAVEELQREVAELTERVLRLKVSEGKKEA